MKKVMTLLMTICMIATVTACGQQPVGTQAASTSVEAMSTSSSETIVDTTEDIDPLKNTPNDPRLEQISVEYKDDPESDRIIVTVTNNSPDKFTADVSVRFNDTVLGELFYDIIFVEDLAAGESTSANIDRKHPPVDLQVEYSEVNFEDAPSTDNAVLNEELTATLIEEFGGSFGGIFGGESHPDAAASWYSDVTEIEVFDGAEECYADVTVSVPDNADMIGNCIFTNYAMTSDSLGLDRVKVLSSDGNILFERAN